jgi:hypothetical protein
MPFRVRRLEIEDDKCNDKEIVYSIRNMEAEKALAKAVSFVEKKGGNNNFFKFLKKDFEEFGKALKEVETRMMGR